MLDSTLNLTILQMSRIFLCTIDVRRASSLLRRTNSEQLNHEMLNMYLREVPQPQPSWLSQSI